MTKKSELKVNLKGLDELLKNLKEKAVVKLGIFSDNNSRTEGLTNAEIGAKHEFGSLSEGIPRRSFLLDPIVRKKKELIKKAQRVIKDNIAKKDGKEKILELIGIAGEAIVQEAFETGGFGMWKALSQITINKKGSDRILIDSSQLRRAVTSKVDKE